MITGFNTDVEYDGRVYHVQTEDKGRGNPFVESLVYTGGEIIDSIRSSYQDIASNDGYSEAEVLRRMELQHQNLLRDIRNGKYDPEGPKPFGYNIISNRSLDAVVLDYLTNELGVEQIRLEMEEHQTLVEGQSPTLRLRVIEESTERPVAGSKVVIKLISTRGKPRELFAGTSDEDGRVEASFEIPALPDAETAVLCQAEAVGTNSEIKQFVRKAGDSTPAAPPADASTSRP